jgi:hypothetical protein
MTTLVLVACVAGKLSHPAPAAQLYTSPWFKKASALAARTGCPWAILSAEHGLVDPARVIAPYERTLAHSTPTARRAWAIDVFRELLARYPDVHRVVFLAGQLYRRELGARLEMSGITVEVPMQALGIGEQLHFLDHAEVAA